MKKGLKLLAVLLSMFVCVKGAYADSVCSDYEVFKIQLVEFDSTVVNWVKIYNYTTDGLEIDNDNISYDATTNTLTFNALNTDGMLRIYNVDGGLTVNLVGENAVDTIEIVGTDVSFTGDGNLNVSSIQVGNYYCDVTEEDIITFDMSGTVTINGYIIVQGTIKLSDSVSLEDGYSIYSYSNEYTLDRATNVVSFNYISTSEVDSSIVDEEEGFDAAKTAITDQLTETIVIKPVETTNTLTSTDSNVTFTSSDGINSSYSLNTEELLSTLSTDALNTILSAKDNSSLLVLYDVKVVDASGATVTMKNGNYVIRFYLSSAEQAKYSSLVGIYVNDEGAVAETFDVTVDGDYVEFTTTHLSNYGILGISNVTTTSNTTTTTVTDVAVENPSTYDNIYNIIALVVVGLAGTGVMAYKLKRR